MSLESNSAEKICRIFAGGKTCKFGRNCRFRHTQNSESNEDGILSRNQEQPFGDTQHQLCFSYTKNRFCKFGARCRFVHQIPQDIQRDDKTKEHGVLSSDKQSSGGADFQSARPYFSIPLPQHKGDAGNESNVPRNDPENEGINQNRQRHDEKLTEGEKRRKNYDVRRRGGNGPRPTAQNNRGNTKQDERRAADSLQHEQQDSHVEDVGLPAADVPVEESDEKAAKPKRRIRQNRKRLCWYFKAGKCQAGNDCRFWHPAEKTRQVSQEDEDKENTTPVTPKEEKVIFARPNEFQLDDFMEEKAAKMRQKEIDQILKRFPKASHAGSDKDGTWSCEVNFTPTDPDWVYDLKEIRLKIILPVTYPLMSMIVMISGEHEQMPNTVFRFTGKSIKEWIANRFADYKSQGKGELMFLPFVRWLDRSLEGILTEGLKLYRKELVAAAAGIQLIAGSELQEQYAMRQATSSEDDDEDDAGESESDDSEEDEEEYDDDFPLPQPSHVGELPDDGTSNPKSSEDLDAARKGTEVKFQKLELAENTATLKLRKVKLIVQCLRCKDKADVSTPVGKLNAVVCGKCSQSMLVLFRASLMHQFSAIAGYIDLENCSAFDLILIDCNFEVGCFNCNRDMLMEGLLTGQQKDTFCHHCHKKMRIATESVRFQQLQSANIFDASDARILQAAKKTKKLPKDPAIQPGKPLPGEGTCKHYKKSYRWLRFPCCGKAFPCDICHEDSEGDHEMARANRMICGFCCREQPYSAEKPCVECGYNLIKKSSSHWEGGKGCRDKVKMSRDDAKKFSNMSKTVSKRAQAKKDASKGKKKTKLRHV